MKIICYLFTRHRKRIKTRRIMRRPGKLTFRAVAEKVRQTKRECMCGFRTSNWRDRGYPDSIQSLSMSDDSWDRLDDQGYVIWN